MKEEHAILDRLEKLTAQRRAQWTALRPDLVLCRVGEERVTFEFLYPWVEEGVVSGADALRATIGDTAGVVCVWFSGSELYDRASRLIAAGVAPRGEWHEACRARLRSFADRLDAAGAAAAPSANGRSRAKAPRKGAKKKPSRKA